MRERHTRMAGGVNPARMHLIPALRWTKQGCVLIAALLTGPALLMGEWGYRAVFGAPAWALLEVVTSLTVITVAVALGGLAGDRLATLIRGE